MRGTTLYNDSQLRTAEFHWLGHKLVQCGDVPPLKTHAKGFDLNGIEITLMNMSGIWRPRELDVAQSIRTGSDNHYNDKNYSALRLDMVKKDDVLSVMKTVRVN